MAVETILTFNAGDTVPEWLIYVDPKTPDAVCPKTIFAVSGVIVLFEGQHWLLSRETSAPSLIKTIGGSHCRLGALTHDLVLPFQFQIIRADEGATA